MLVDIVCRCGRSIKIDDKNLNTSPCCPYCGKELSVEDSSRSPNSAPEPDVPGEDLAGTIANMVFPTDLDPPKHADQADFESQTTIFNPSESTDFDPEKTQTALYTSAGESISGTDFQLKTGIEGAGGNDSKTDEPSTRYCTPAEKLLNADPFYRISRAKRSEQEGGRDPNKGFVYGIHRILRSHVKGGMGMVHIAYDQFLKREVALKELFKESTTDESIVHRFIVEAEITAQLEHPGIVPIHSLGLDLNGNPYYTMKLIRGRTLQEAIKQYFKEPSEPELKRLVRRFVSVCQTMAFVHNKGVIHRDLKPANIMLSEHGETLVMDWGIAKPFNKPEEGTSITVSDTQSLESSGYSRPDLTLVGTVVGTPAFMSPEQASPEHGEVGPISDIFSLGAILFYMLTGRNAYTGKNSQEILTKVLTTAPPKPSDVARNIPPGLEAICLKAMARNPKNRYQSADELVADLCNWLDGEPISAMKEGYVEKLWRCFQKNRQMSLGVFVSIIAFFVVFSLAVILINRAMVHSGVSQTESRIVKKRIEEVYDDIRKFEQESRDIRAEYEGIRMQRSSDDDPAVQSENKNRSDALLKRIQQVDDRLSELQRLQKELKKINSDILESR